MLFGSARRAATVAAPAPKHDVQCRLIVDLALFGVFNEKTKRFGALVTPSLRRKGQNAGLEVAWQFQAQFDDIFILRSPVDLADPRASDRRTNLAIRDNGFEKIDRVLSDLHVSIDINNVAALP